MGNYRPESPRRLAEFLPILTVLSIFCRDKFPDVPTAEGSRNSTLAALFHANTFSETTRPSSSSRNGPIPENTDAIELQPKPSFILKFHAAKTLNDDTTKGATDPVQGCLPIRRA